MKRKILLLGIGIAAALLALALKTDLFREKTSSENSIQLGLQWCMPDSLLQESMADRPELRRAFIEYALLDSSGHYYSRSLLTNKGDTLHLSSFPALQYRELEQAIRDRFPEVKAVREERIGDETAYHWLLTSADRFLVRIVLPESRFEQFVLLDYLSADSSRARHFYQKNITQQGIQPCQ